MPNLLERINFLLGHADEICVIMNPDSFTLTEKKKRCLLVQIGCTKKLLDFLKKDGQPYDKEIDPFYRWTANLIVVNRRKTLIAVNDAVRCGFVLYGLTAPVRKQLDWHLREGIRRTLLAERIDPQLVEKYLDDCGENITYTKTGDLSVVSRLNQLILDLEYSSEPWEEGEIYQPDVTLEISGIIYSVAGKYYVVREELHKQFDTYYSSEFS